MIFLFLLLLSLSLSFKVKQRHFVFSTKLRIQLVLILSKDLMRGSIDRALVIVSSFLTTSDVIAAEIIGSFHGYSEDQLEVGESKNLEL